jgi:hypothetical protein
VTLKAFLFLLVVTIVAVVGAALIAEAIVGPGFERGVLIAVLAGLVVFPAARWAEYRGWIKGDWSPGGTLRKAQDERREREAADKQQPAGNSNDGKLPNLASGTPQDPSSAGGDRIPAAGPTSPGDSR